MSKLQKILSAYVLSLSLLLGVVFTIPALAGPFDASSEQACKGAALDSGNVDCDNLESEATSKVSETIQNIIDLLSIVVGIIAVILIIVNGLRFITSNGDSNAISSAKNGIIYAIIGLIIVAFAQVIVRFVIERTA